MQFTKNKTRVLIAIIMFSCSIPNIAYANEKEQWTEENINYNQEVDLNTLPKIGDVTIIGSEDEKLLNKTWVQDYTKKWKYVNGYGEASYGLFADEKGDIYYGGHDGYIYTNKLDEYGQYFGSDGRLVNLGAHLINNDKAKEYADILDKGEVLSVDSDYDVKGFLEYYLGQDYIYIQPAMVTQDKRGGDKIKLKLYNTPTYNREEVEKAIDSLIGDKPLDTETSADIVLSACIRLKESTVYDDRYVLTDIITCINDKKACCRQYACILSYLLNKNGVYAEEVQGVISGPHSWVRAFYDNKWHYIDVSAYIETFNKYYLDMEYQFYMDNYKTIERIHLK